MAWRDREGDAGARLTCRLDRRIFADTREPEAMAYLQAIDFAALTLSEGRSSSKGVEIIDSPLTKPCQP